MPLRTRLLPRTLAAGRAPALALLLLALALALTPALAAPAAPAAPAWVERSNANTQVLLEVLARQSPETAGRLGVPGLDEQILDLKPGFIERQKKDVAQAIATLRGRLEKETDPAVRQDLGILIDTAERNVEGADLSEKLLLPYIDMHQTVFQGIHTLLDEQVDAVRRPAALVRMRRYAGLEKGYVPVTELAMAYTRERMQIPGLLGPVKAEIERDLSTGPTYIKGLGELFGKYGIKGYEAPLKSLQRQLDAYEAFLRAEVVPRARDDFRQPPDLYAFSLKQFGIDMPVAELVSRAQVAFMEIRFEMQSLAPRVAKEDGLVGNDGAALTDYHDVIRALKAKQLTGDAILPHYQRRIADMEELIRKNHLVTLPDRAMRIQLATEAESATQPAPNMRPPRLIGNTGEMGTFMLPLRALGPDGKVQAYDDFTFEAASWTLVAHEGRPGHELQFAAMVEKGVSLARAIFAFNSVNVEGWGLYAEAIMKPYLPLDGQLIGLQHRLMRASRAFLDPGLQLGTITRDEAMRILQDEVMLSQPMANQEVERYTFRAPGQAPSYFCGYTRLMELRTEAERTLGPRFDAQKYHDFILSQGLLPPTLLKKAVREQFLR